MASDPLIRDRIFCELEKLKCVSGADLAELRHKLDMSDVSNTTFAKALGSMRHHYGIIFWRRFWPKTDTVQSKHHTISLRNPL